MTNTSIEEIVCSKTSSSKKQNNPKDKDFD